MESINQRLSASIDLYVREMRVTRNTDDGEKQDPFMTFAQYKLPIAAWNSVNKSTLEVTQKPIKDKHKSKIHKNGGKEVDFKEALSLDVNMDLKNTGEVLEPVVNEV